MDEVVAAQILETARREQNRWHTLQAVDVGRTTGVADALLVRVLQSVDTSCSLQDVRKYLEYLDGKKLIELRKHEDGSYCGYILAAGTDVVEYAVDCPVGIQRPARGG